MTTLALEHGQPTEITMTQEDVARQILEAKSRACVDAYHALWYHAVHTWPMTRYKGVPILKAPNDLQVYHEILWQLRPTLVIETGTCYGGSALWFADQVSAWGGRVVSIDLQDKRHIEPVNPENAWPAVEHDAIEWILGDSLDPSILNRCETLAAVADGPVLVTLDSDHHAAHVARELEAYAPFVTRGSFVVVEDTNVSGRPIVADDPGPGAAVDAWLEGRTDFVKNVLCERYLLTMHPGGWLARVE